MDIVGNDTSFKTWKQKAPGIGNPYIQPYNACGMNYPNNYYQLSDVFVR